MQVQTLWLQYHSLGQRVPFYWTWKLAYRGANFGEVRPCDVGASDIDVIQRGQMIAKYGSRDCRNREIEGALRGDLGNCLPFSPSPLS